VKIVTNKGDPKVDELPESELARYFEDRKDDDTIWQLKGRKIRARRGPSTLFQMRIAPEELEEIAAAAGGNISEFVRTAALEKARRMTEGVQLSEQELAGVSDAMNLLLRKMGYTSLESRGKRLLANPSKAASTGTGSRKVPGDPTASA
jgi:hypothetical protein